MQLAEKLNKLLDEKGETQADVCRETGLSSALVSQVFSGKTKDPRLSTVTSICEYFYISLGELMEGVDLDD